MFLKASSAAIISLACMVPSVVLADSQSDSPSSTDSISQVSVIDEIVVTGTRTGADSRLLPMTVSVVDENRLTERCEPNILPTLTQDVPGMFVTQRGVQDLLELIQTEPNRLKGAVCADKIIGKAAAALMVVGGVKEVRTNIICEEGKELLEQNGVKIVADEVVPMILNRDRSGQCPIDSKLNEAQTASECVEILKNMPKR